jgi:hypothetical protein
MRRSRLVLATMLAALGIAPVLLTVAPGAAPAAPVPKPLFPKKETSPDYFPVRVGNTWAYQAENVQLLGLDRGSTEYTEVVSNVEDVEGARVASIDTSWAGSPVYSNNYKLRVAPDGIFKIGVGDARFDPPVCLHKHESRPGDTWETHTHHVCSPEDPFFNRDGNWRHLDVTWSMTVGEWEVVDVPAGTFRARRVDQTVRRYLSLTEEQSIWYASRVGVVKFESSFRPYSGRPTDRQRPTTYSLKSFTPGKE